MRYLLALALSLTLLSLLGGCGGVNTFTTSAQPGSTIAVPAGWRHGFTRDSIAVTITDSASNVIMYPVGDERIRAVTNLYPDPVSSLVVDTRINHPNNYGVTINDYQTDGDNDWWQTLVVLDLPTELATGQATVQLDGPDSESFGPVYLNVLPGVGTPDPLQAGFAFGDVTLSTDMLAALGRAPHYTIQFSGATMPHAIEITLTHDPDSTAGGTGRALAINPRGDLKNLSWSDDGVNMRVILMHASNMTAGNIKDYKFYVSGGIDNLSINSVTAFDESGGVMQGITASCSGGCI